MICYLPKLGDIALPVQIVVVSIKADTLNAGEAAQVFKGKGKLVRILQPPDIGIVIRIIGSHLIYQRVHGQNIKYGIQSAKGLLYGRRRVLKCILCSNKGLLLYHAAHAQIGVQGKNSKRKRDQKEIGA